MRTAWEQARAEAIGSAVKRGMVTLQGDAVVANAAAPATAAVANPTLAAQITAIVSDVAAKVKELYPAAKPEEVNQSALQKALIAVEGTMAAKKQKAPGLQVQQASTGMSQNTKMLLVIGAGAALGLGAIVYFRNKRT